MNQAIENRIKKISIRGRMALGIKCLEIKLEKDELINKVEIKKLLSKLWEFISSKRLDLWEEKILDYEPESLIEDFENEKFEDFKNLKKEEIKALYEIYKKSKSNLAELISWVIEIGRGNLYSATGKFSEGSLNPTIEVLKIMERSNLPIPDLAKFEKSKYSEFHGWGIEREKSFFR